jgi:16S rRNA (uracil1498-N3)-methyltransferase
MEILPVLNFDEACKKAVLNKDFINILPWESEADLSISQLLNDKKEQNANIFIGPEGGFENKEIDFAKSLNFHTISLGENILRVETAAIAACVLVINNIKRSKTL